MAAKPLSMDRLKKALSAYAADSGQTISEGETDGKKRFLLDPGSVTCSIEDGRLLCSSQSVKEKLAEILTFQDEEVTVSPVEARSEEAKGIMPSAQRNGQGGATGGLVSQAEMKKIAEIKENRITSRSQDPALKAFHQKRSSMYQVEGGNAPTAAMVSREANRFRLCTDVLEYVVTDDLVRAKVRVTDPVTGQYKEDGVAFTRTAFIAKKTIDIIAKHIKKNPQLVEGIDPVSLHPILSDSAMIYDLPARLFVAKEVLKSWNFLGRFAVTTAERRCQDKLLNAEFREKEEIELERAEMMDVAEGSA